MDAVGQPLVGRVHEQAVLMSIVDGLTGAAPPRPTAGSSMTDRRGGAALAVTGETGVGKSALLSVTIPRAEQGGVRVLRADGCHGEADIPGAGLVQLLLPVAELLDELPEQLADTLRSVLGIGTAEQSPAPGSVAIAVLSLLQRLALRYPVLIVLDDADRVDRDSLHALLYAARRLRVGDGVAIVLAGRDERSTLPADTDLPALELGPLPAAQAAELFDRLPNAPLGRHRREMLDGAAGNPLALEELARHGSPWPLVATGRLETLFARRLRALPTATARLLLYAAAAVDEPPARVMRAAGHDDIRLWEPAEREGLIVVEPGAVVFRHPLLRVAAYASASAADRRNAHLDLAAVTAEPAAAAWQRAYACTGPDEQVAQALEVAAEQAARRGAAGTAARTYERAAQCSPAPPQRVRRSLAALRAAHEHGDTTRIADLHTALLEHTDDAGELATATLAAASSSILQGRQREAFGLLRAAITSCPTDQSEPVLPLLITFASVAVRSGLTEHEHAVADVVTDAVARLTEDITGHPPDRYRHIAITYLRTRHDPTLAAAALDRLPAPGTAGITAARDLLVLGALAAHAYDTRRHIEATEQGISASSGPGIAAHTSGALAAALVEAGRWNAADHLVDRWSQTADTHHMPVLAAELAAARATLLALRGRPAAASALLADAGVLVDSDENLAVEIRLDAAHAVIASTTGSSQEAYRALRSAFSPDGTPRHRLLSPPLIAQLAASARNTDDQTDARAVLDRVHAWCGARPPTRLRVQLHHADALLGPPLHTERHFRMALADPAAEEWPLERAVTRLHYGEWLRRRRRAVEARDILSAALTTFVRLGAEAPAARVRAELRAAGVTPGADLDTAGDTVSDTDPLSALTAQQREIVRLAAQGLRNREIADRLFLSPRTVGSHLHHAYPKLGVTGRHQLHGIVQHS